MGRKSNVYSKVVEADEIIKKLCEKQPSVLWAIGDSKYIVVMGIEDKERSKKNKTLAKIKPVRGTEKAIYQINQIPYRYIIEVYWSDWNLWSHKERAAILFHELLHIHPEGEKTVKHDCEDFRIVLDKLGVDWFKKGSALPDLTSDDVKFNLELRPAIEDLDEESGEEDNIDEIEKNKRSRRQKSEADEQEKLQRKESLKSETEPEEEPDEENVLDLDKE
jgi:predicted metallopeptidase